MVAQCVRVDLAPRIGRGDRVLPDVGDIIRDPAEVAAFMATVADAPFVAVDSETSGLDPLVDRLLLVQVGTPTRTALIDAQAVGPEALVPLFPPDQIVVLQNAPFDLKMLAGFGVPVKPLAQARIMDTMICEQLIRSGRKTELSNGRVSLNVLAERYAGMTLDKSVRAGFFNLQSADDLGEAELRYAERDVEATWRVFAKQLELLVQDGLLRVAAIEGSAAWAFAQMELSGFPIDADAWRGLVEAAGEARLERKAVLDGAFRSVAQVDLFGVSTINYESDQEVLRALKDLGVQVESTRAEILLATGHPAAKALVDYREHQKIVSTYGDKFLEHVHAKDGRLHSRFKPIGASTGRVSSSDPNLQNIPKGSQFRACFRAPDGRKLITADYAGAELRILAEVSGDPVFIRTFQDGGDLHAIVASQMFGQPVSKSENRHLRDRAKAINFGLVYGMGAGGLAAQIGASMEEASQLLERYFRHYPAIRGYLDEAARGAIRRGWAETLAGRRHRFIDMKRRHKDDASIGRVAKNMPIQGTNADMSKLAMGRICRVIAERDLDAKLVNMIHDEIVVEASDGDAEAVREVVVQEMESAGGEFVKRVPMLVEANIDDTWSH